MLVILDMIQVLTNTVIPRYRGMALFFLDRGNHVAVIHAITDGLVHINPAGSSALPS
jgi:hypothetical protein